MRKCLVESATQLAQRVIGQTVVEGVGHGTEDRPVLPGVAGRKAGAIGELHAALGIDEGSRLLRVGGAGKDDVGAVSAGIAVGADVDDESLAKSLDVDLVGAEEEERIEGVVA